jgi:hypothetical protein
MEPQRARLAVEKLGRRRSVEKLLRLNEVRKTPELAADTAYQRAFKGYYRMGRRRAAFYDAFFAILHDCASAPKSQTPPTLKVLLKLLYEAKASFLRFKIAGHSRRLGRHFRPKRSVVLRGAFDSFARRSLARGGDSTVRRNPERHSHIHKRGRMAAIRDLFDRSFPNARHLPDVRKADLVIWADYAAWWR